MFHETNGAPVVRITDVRTVLLTGPSTHDPWLAVLKRTRTAAFVEVHTDVGVTGVGETYLGYFLPDAVAPVVEFVKPILLAADAVDVPVLAARMRTSGQYWDRTGIGAAALAGVEAALWDLAGRLEGVPVHVLLGGAKHDDLPAYATGGPAPAGVPGVLEKADFYRGLGFTALKMSTGGFDVERREWVEDADAVAVADREVEKLAALRKHLGGDVGIALDAHMGHKPERERWDVDTAAGVLSALAEYRPLFVEEPLAYDDVDGYARLAGESEVRVAGGEQFSSSAEFRVFADRDALDLAQPDASWLGISDFLEVARIFARAGRAVAPHSWGAGGAVLQNLHAAFAVGNTAIVELPPAPGPLHTELWGDQVHLVEGRVQLPTRSGLGIELTDEIKDRYPFVPGAEEFVSVPGKRMDS